MQSCISPPGRFLVGIHCQPYEVANLRQRDHLQTLGLLADGREIKNAANFPAADVKVEQARPIYEIINPFYFRGCTYIDSAWAGARANNPDLIGMEKAPPEVSLRKALMPHAPLAVQSIIQHLPLPLRHALAAVSTDAEELIWLAHSCCAILTDAAGNPSSLAYVEQQGRAVPAISSFELFETIANNPHLPDSYKEVMALRPGVQGDSPITADLSYQGGEIFEYLRANSYIPGGHYAANFAPQSIRYRIADLNLADMRGLRRLYYQRIFVTVARRLGLDAPCRRRACTASELESLRQRLVKAIDEDPDKAAGLATLWGWNFGYDFSASGYRLHASHQMIHQQYALTPPWVQEQHGELIHAFSCGDQIAAQTADYRTRHQADLFADYLKAIDHNTRTDQGEGEQSLIVWRDAQVMLFVPKAQVSQWELNLMVCANSEHGPVGNVVEADAITRDSIDYGILVAQHILEELGARMVTSIEYAKRLGRRNGQRLLYAFLPKLPWAMGGFSEAQGRFILSHYPEDFAFACRKALERKKAQGALAL